MRGVVDALQQLRHRHIRIGLFPALDGRLAGLLALHDLVVVEIVGAGRGLAARLVADAGHAAAVGQALEVAPDDAVVDRVLQDGEEVGGRRPAHLQPQLAGAGIEHHVGLVAVVLKPHPLAPVQVLAVVVRQHDEPAHDAVGHEVQVEDHAHFRLIGQHLRPGGKLRPAGCGAATAGPCSVCGPAPAPPTGRRSGNAPTCAERPGRAAGRSRARCAGSRRGRAHRGAGRG